MIAVSRLARGLDRELLFSGGNRQQSGMGVSPVFSIPRVTGGTPIPLLRARRVRFCGLADNTVHISEQYWA